MFCYIYRGSSYWSPEQTNHTLTLQGDFSVCRKAEMRGQNFMKPDAFILAVCGRGLMSCDLTCLPSGPSPSSSPSLLTKSLSLEPSCSPCSHQGALDADAPQQMSSDPGPSSSSGPASLEGGPELTARCGSANGLLLVNDTGPPELPATTVTTQSKSRPPLPGPKPQGKTSFIFEC